MKAMTVAELIKQLSMMPQDAIVWSDGCDCQNPVTGATFEADSPGYGAGGNVRLPTVTLQVDTSRDSLDEITATPSASA